MCTPRRSLRDLWPAAALVLLSAFAAGSALAWSGWTVQSSPVATNLSGVDFVDPSRGWICGAGGVILHTTDGGEHWQQQASGTTQCLRAISFADSLEGYAVGCNWIILHTTDGGTTWQNSYESGMATPWNAVQAMAPGELRFVGDDFGSPLLHGALCHSSNGGASWSTHSVSCSDPPHTCTTVLRALSLIDAQNIVVAGGLTLYSGSTLGTAYRSTDGGATFDELFAQWYYEKPCSGVRFLDPLLGFIACGQAGRTTDGGTNWTWQDPGIMVTQLSFVDAERGWMVGTAGGIVRTTDGGTTWTVQTSGTAQNLNAVKFLDGSVGTAVGNNGTILHTINGGEVDAAVDEPMGPAGYRLLAGTPNPFTADTRISYDLKARAEIRLAVYDASGRWVKTLDHGLKAPGRHEASWNGADASARPAPSGVYFVRLSGPAGSCGQRVLIAR
jgi:photosystem II stability/assembly factor-like uncharacterized protein